MKKVYIVVLTVLVILSAFLIVQAQNDNQGSTVTEAVVTPTAIPAAEENKTEPAVVNEPEQQPEVVNEPEQQPEVVNEPEQQPEVVNEPEQQPEVVNEPEQQPEVVNEPEQQPEVVNEPEQQPEVVNEPEQQPEVVNEAEQQPEVVNEPEQLPEVVNEPEQQPEVVNEPEQEPEVVNEPEQQQVTPTNDDVVETDSQPTEAVPTVTETPEVQTTEPGSEPTEKLVQTEVPTAAPLPTETPEPTKEPVDEHVYDEVIVSIKGSQVSVTYDGQRHQATGYEVVGISNEAYQASDFIFTGSASAELYDAGIAYMGLNDAMFVNKNNKFVNVYFDIEDGFIEIYPINVEIEIIGNSETAVYDGEMHSAYGYEFKQIRPENPQIVTAESFGLKDGKEPFVESDQVGVFGMGLTNNSFENYNPNFNRVLFNVTDGFVEITPSEQDLIEEELVNENEVISEEPVNEGNPEPESDDTNTDEQKIEQVNEPAADNNQSGLGAGTVIYAAPDQNAEILMTTESDTNLVILGTLESGWIEVQMEDGLIGYVPTSDSEVTDEPVNSETETEPVIEEQIVEEETVPSETVVEEEVESNNSNPEIQENTVSLAAGTVIYAAPDAASDVLVTLESDSEFTVVSTDESGWMSVQLDEQTTGYIPVSVEQEEVEENPAETVENPVNETETEPEVESDSLVTFAAGTVIYSAPDETSDVLMTLEADAEFTVVSTDEAGWIAVQLDEAATGYVQVSEEEQEETVENPVDETEVEPEIVPGSLVSFAAGTVIYSAPEETSDVLMTLEADAEFTVVNTDTAGWIAVQLDEATTGYIQVSEEEQEEAEENPEETVENPVDETEVEPEIVPGSLVSFASGTVVYSAPDETSDVLMTLEADTEFTVVSTDEAGWIAVQLDEATTGYVQVSGEEQEEAEEETQETLYTFIAGTEFYESPDETSNVVMTLEEDTELSILAVDEFGWAEVQLTDTLTGFVFLAEYAPTEEQDDEYNQLLPAGTNIRANADGMSDIIYTAAEDIYVKILSRENEDWIQVETKDGITGFVFHSDIPLEGEIEDTPAEPTAKVLIFTSRRAIMDLGEEIKLTSVIEGMPEDVVLTYQWECDKGDGFEPVEGGNSDSYSYEASVESLSWSWRLVVSY